jgi:hypothetical protein
MIIFTLIRKLLTWGQNSVAAFFHRWDKKNDNLRGFMFGGPKNAKRLAIIFMAFIVAMFVATIMIKKGVFTPVGTIIDRETAPGTKLPSSMVESIDKADIMRGMEQSQAQNTPDCDSIIRNLKIRGSMTSKEKLDFEKFCRDKIPAEMAKIIEKIISGEIPESAVADVVSNLSENTAASILKALESEDVKMALRGDAKEAVAKNLAAIGKLADPSAIKKAVTAISSAPPQFRSDVVDAVRSIAELKSPEAKNDMLSSLAIARSPDEVKSVREFADVLQKATEDEQEIFAKAFTKAPDLETRNALRGAVAEIVQIPEGDPVREKLTDFVKQASELPPGEQRAAYGKIANVANAYRTETDPDLKRALGDAILQSKNIGELGELSDRIVAIQEALPSGAVSKEMQIAALSGRDPEILKKVMAAAAAMRSGDKELAAAILNDQVPEDKVASLAASSEARSKTFFGDSSGQGGSGTNAANAASDVSKDKLDSLVKERRKLKKESEKTKEKINEYMRLGVPLSDARMLAAMKALSKLDDDSKSLDASISDMRNQLRQRLKEIRDRTSADFARAGVAIPNLDVGIPDDVIEGGEPAERLTDLDEYKEFWDYDDGVYGKKNRRYFKFNMPDGSASKNGSMLDSFKKTEWLAATPGGGNSGSPSGKVEFEMSRTLVIPGVLRRIPGTCIPSDKASSYTILFEFLAPVSNRKTGRVEIPTGSLAICKVKDFENDSARLNATCNAVDVGGKSDIQVNLSIGDANGADGTVGVVIDNRGWQLAGIFLTAFSAAVLDGISAQYISPFEQTANRTAREFLAIGAGNGASGILRDVAQKQIDNWTKEATWWCSYDGALASIRQN